MSRMMLLSCSVLALASCSAVREKNHTGVQSSYNRLHFLPLFKYIVSGGQILNGKPLRFIDRNVLWTEPSGKLTGQYLSDLTQKM